MWGHVGITPSTWWYRHMGTSPRHGDMWTSWCHKATRVAQGTGAGCITSWPTAPTREEGLGEVKTCHNACVGVREQPRDPGGGHPHQCLCLLQ